MNRKCCGECPWKRTNPHSKKWPGYVHKMSLIGRVKKTRHACHMKTSDVWGIHTIIDEKNVCIGSINVKKTDKSSK